jgi:hypothetical protein
VPVRSVRQRRYRGFCAQNVQAQAAAAQFLAAREAIFAALNERPELAAGPRNSAGFWLSGFFEDIATPADVERNLLRNCL